ARFATAGSRRAHDGALAQALGALFATRPAAEWERELIPAGVGCVEATTQNAGTFFAGDEHMRANGFAVEADHPLWGRYQRWGPMMTFSGTPGRYGPGVLAGQHTDALLAELGCTEAEIADLRRDGVVDSAAPMDLAAARA
ncbi:MAG: CoA transferase, partial [Chloroflexi bacterium]|nr:CoA transferase [Chloroflexota bacterium]